MHPRSIRFRLTVWYAVILAAGLSLFSVLIWLSLRHRLMEEIDQDLAGRASQFERYFASESTHGAAGEQLRDELEEFCQALPPSSYVEVRGANGFAFHYPVSAQKPEPTGRTLRRQFTFNQEVFDLEIAAPVANAEHTLDLLRFLLWSMIPVVIVIACLGGAWLSGRALKPVNDIAAAALTISIENLAERLPVPATGDELARLTEVLNSMFARLESAVKTLSQFAADASHELRTPLAVIRTTAELALRRARTPESYRESLQEVAAEAERMTRLVEELLLLARSETATADMPLAAVDVREVLADVCGEMRTLAEMRQIRMNTLPGGVMIVAGNRPALHRLFLVLLDNALKFSRPGGEVVLSVENKESWVSVNIEDFGVGINERDLPHIFERFYRTDRARAAGGHGLGLSLAKSIARAHGASIEVQSTEGAGSKFRVTFVAREARPAVAAETSRVPSTKI
ncbi:MAG: HAMP domain-containing protein [Acidobacteriia bacterium]|nr:HAMP domain-containing protein [Terriglobia bacterium]